MQFRTGSFVLLPFVIVLVARHSIERFVEKLLSDISEVVEHPRQCLIAGLVAKSQITEFVLFDRGFCKC